MTTLIRRAFGRAPSASPWDNREPIREELFSVERLEEHARSLAVAQPVTAEADQGPSAGRPARRQRSGAARCLSHHRQGDRRGPRDHAGGGMADRQLSSRREADPRDPLRSAARLLPAAAQAGRRAVRRISARVRRGLGLRRPHRQPLRSRDAVPLRARLPGGPAADDRRALGGRDHAADRAGRESAGASPSGSCAVAPHGRRRTVSPTACWASAGAPPNRCAVVLADYERAPLPDAFAVQLVHRLRDQDPRITPALTWLDERLAAQGTTADAVVRDEHQRQGAGERHGAQHHHQHAPDLRCRLDGAVRAHQPRRRRACRRQRLSRTWISRRAISTAAPSRNWRAARTARNSTSRAAPSWRQSKPRAATRASEDDRRGDPGYHLLAGGRRAFEAAIGFRPPLRAWLGRLNRALGIGGYVGAIVARRRGPSRVAAVRPGRDGARLGMARPARRSGRDPGDRRGGRAGEPRRDAAASARRSCRRLELRDGVPAHLRTLVAVPTLLTTREAIEEQIERLEIHHLASPEGDLHFALLSDWVDAATEHVEGDDGSARRCRGGHRPAQSALRPGARRRPLPAAPSPAGLERRRRAMDRLGAQARQAARAEPAAARRDRHHLPRCRRAAAAACPPTSATSSRSTPTRGCRATRCAG